MRLSVLMITDKSIINNGGQTLLNTISSNIGTYDIILAPEYAISGQTPLSDAARGVFLERLLGLSGLHETLIAPGTMLWQSEGKLYNFCPLVCNGKILLNYFKETTDHKDAGIASKCGLTFTTGNRQGIINWKGLSVGIEICRDHGHARLKRYLTNYGGGGSVDIHILLSSGMNYIGANSAAHTNGHFMLCDAQSGGALWRGSWHISGKRVKQGLSFEIEP